MRNNRFGLSLLAVIMAAMIIILSACTTENTDSPPETVSVSTDRATDMDDCDEDTVSQDGRGDQLEPSRFTTGEFIGQYNPADIRGSYTLDDISGYFDIPLSVLAEAFNMPEEEAGSIQNKYYKYIYEGLLSSGKNVGNGSMVAFVSMYKGLPFELHEPEYLLEPAADILRNLGTLSQEDLDYISEYVVTIEEAGAIPLADFVPPEDDYDDEFYIYGRTTFGDLLDMGMSKEQIMEIIQAPMPDIKTSVKDYCVENGFSFSDHIKLEIYEILYNL